MADSNEEITLVGGRAIESLRVVDLKQELKKRGICNSGSKSLLIERLKAQIYLEKLKQAPVCDGVPNKNICDDESVASNSFIQQYLMQQQELLKQRPDTTARGNAEEDKAIPEGLANQVEELNQSLSRSQSEEAEKGEVKVKADSTSDAKKDDGDAQPKELLESPQEPSPGSRGSRRSRRQAEEDEAEPEVRRSRRTRHASKDSEHDEAPKESQVVEQLQSIGEERKDKGTGNEVSVGEGESKESNEILGENEVEKPQVEGGSNDSVVNDGQHVENSTGEGDKAGSATAQFQEKESISQLGLGMKGSESETVDQESIGANGDAAGGKDEKMETAPVIQNDFAPDEAMAADAMEPLSQEIKEENKEDERAETDHHFPEQEKSQLAGEQVQQESGSQRKVKLNRSGDLSRAKAAERTQNPDPPPEVKSDGVAAELEQPVRMGEEGAEDARGKCAEGSPRKRTIAEYLVEDELSESSKRRKTEADEDEKLAIRKNPKSEEEPAAEEEPASESSSSASEESSSASEESASEEAEPAYEEEPVSKEIAASSEMGRGDGRDTVAADTGETEDGEIKDNGEAQENGEGQGEEDAGEERKKGQEMPKAEERQRSKSVTVSAPVKTKRDSFSSKEKPKENDDAEGTEMKVGLSGQATSAPPVIKKRRWGSTKKVADDPTKKSNVNISTDLLKGIIPDIKASEMLSVEQEEEPVTMDAEEVTIDTKEKEEKESEMPDTLDIAMEPPKRKFIRQTITAPGAVEDEESDIDYEDDEVVQRKVKQEEGEKGEDKHEDEGKDGSSSGSSSSEEEDKAGDEGDGEDGEKTQKPKKSKEIKEEQKEEKKIETKGVKIHRLKTAVRTVIDEPVRHSKRDPSPSKRTVSKIVHVNNLVRPFTLGQLKELLGRYGSLDNSGFWINNIKSHCYATYETSESAVACREALHGTTWPSSNPKTLRVDFADTNELGRHMGVTTVLREEPRPEPRSPERGTAGAAAARGERISTQDRERDVEQERRTRERARERERARKEREWDRGKERSQSRERRRRQRSQERRERHDEVKKEVEEPPAKLLDDLFRKTKATPCIYWLPLTEQMIVERDKQRAERDQRREQRAEQRKAIEEEERAAREKQREERLKRDRDRERERVRARERSRSRERRSRSRSRGRRR